MSRISNIVNRSAEHSRILAVLVFLTVMTAPFYLGVHHLRIFTSMLILGLFGVGFNLAFGFTDLPSFGHAAFFGLGAYGFAMTMDFLEPSTIFVPIIIAGLVTTIFAFVIGIISLRGKGIYFALLTFAFAQFLYEIFFRTTNITGGDDGLLVFVPELLGINFADPINVHLTATILLTATLIASYRLLQSPFGKTMKAIRHNPERAKAIGYPVKRIQIIVFSLSAFVSSLAGILYVFSNQFVSPSVLYWEMSVEVLIITIIGGATTLAGPIIGAAIYTILTELLRDYANIGTVVLGATFIAIILYASDGLVGEFKDRYLE